MSRRRGARALGISAAVLLVLIGLPVALHLFVAVAAHAVAPAVDAERLPIHVEEGAGGPVNRAGRGWSTKRGVRIVHLRGTPEEIGSQHASLLFDRMVENETVLWDAFTELVPFAPARALLFDLGRFQHRNVASNFPPDRLREIAAEARAFTPDPFADRIPTFERLVTLHALYDISLGFEHSPLLGCTSFALTSPATADGHVLFARAFDFEAADVFDDDKAVFVVHETGKLPFASVAWPGLVGVLTGMNAEGVAISAHGGRARETRSLGVPMALGLREVLATARDADEAARLLAAQEVMVSGIVFVADPRGRALVVERAPGVPAFVREANAGRGPGRFAVTNHFEGPLASDPKNLAVREKTSTVARRARMDELLTALPDGTATVTSALAMLRDHTCAGGAQCQLGDRRTIDAFLATHGVVADLTTKTLWISEGPQLSGRFVKLDPASLVQRDEDASVAPPGPELEALPADEVMNDDRYQRGRANSGAPLLKTKAPEKRGTK